MISPRLENTKPINLILIFSALILGLLLYDIFIFDANWDISLVFSRIGNAFLLLVSLVVLSSIDRWNELTQDNSYAIFFFAVFCVVFPNSYQNSNILMANLLIITAFWRILSLHTEEDVPQKIFDASFLIACAGLLNVWAFIFLLNTWISLLYYGSKKRKYWLIPFVAIFCIGVLLSTFLILFKIPFSLQLFSFEINRNQLTILPNFVGLCITAVMLLVSVVVYLFKQKYHSGSSQTIIQFLLVGLAVVFFSSEPIFIFAQLSILFALYVEKIEKIKLKEGILWFFLSIPILILALHFFFGKNHL